MVIKGSLGILVPWVGFLLILELSIDLTCLAACIRWFITADKKNDTLALRLGTAAALLHAVRVLIFVLGRTGPWYNLDVRPEYQAQHSETWTMFGLYLAAILAVLGVTGVIIIWRLRIRARKKIG